MHPYWRSFRRLPGAAIATPAPSPNDPAARVDCHEKHHTANRPRYQDPIKQVHIINEGKPIPAWWKMTNPAVREIGAGIWVASAAGLQKVLFDNAGIRVRYF